MRRSANLAIVVVAFAATMMHARVISYAPLTDRPATPAVQHRMNRHFVLVEHDPFVYDSDPVGRIVLYDARGEEEPRVVFPFDNKGVVIGAAAVREDERQVPTILIQAVTRFNGSTTEKRLWLMSSDGGRNWITVDLPPEEMHFFAGQQDAGGYYAHGRFSDIRIGTREFPFVLAFPGSVYAVARDASVKRLITIPATSGRRRAVEPSREGYPPVSTHLIGSDREGRRFLVTSAWYTFIVDLDGNFSQVATNNLASQEGWITPDGGVFVEEMTCCSYNLVFWKNRQYTPMFTESFLTDPRPVIAVPAADFASAWILDQTEKSRTVLWKAIPNGVTSPPHRGIDFVEMWSDTSTPRLEALHPSASGGKILFQSGGSDLRLRDVRLSVWHLGDPPPRKYDHVLINVDDTHEFVHLDVDAYESGDAFVFDSGLRKQYPFPNYGTSGSAGGGSEVIAEAGVVRAFSSQTLFLPMVNRTTGAFGSRWITDVTLYNPGSSPLSVDLQFTSNGDDDAARLERTVSLQSREIRVLGDLLGTLFGLEEASGALQIVPPAGTSVDAVSRTYTTSRGSTYGYSTPAVDVGAALGSRFRATFAGAFEGPNFQTTLSIADSSPRGTEATLTASSNGTTAAADVTVVVPSHGQNQVSRLSSVLGLAFSDTGSLTVQANRGEALTSALVTDDRTGDPTFFSPDLLLDWPARGFDFRRVIPAISRMDNADGSKVRSDLFLTNTSSGGSYVQLSLSPTKVRSMVLLPHETRVVRDVLSLFQTDGVAPLAVSAQSVRVTSKTYSVDPAGGTYGCSIPPLNALQWGLEGDAVEILGTTLNGSRTDFGMIGISTAYLQPPQGRVEIVGASGSVLDAFDVTLPEDLHREFSDLFHARHLPEGQEPVLLRVTVVKGKLAAYAISYDKATSDPNYFAGKLAEIK